VVGSSGQIAADERMTLKIQMRKVGVRLAQLFGTRIIDQRTGRIIGRAFVMPWRGKIHVIGLDTPARVHWIPQERVTYWKQEIGFETHPPPDYPNEKATNVGSERRKERGLE
jgi:hypothetical protein